MSRIPLPRPLKDPLVSAWNEAHRWGWLARDYASAFLSRSIGHCNVCGEKRAFFYRRRVIPPKLVELWGLSERQAAALARKESCDCSGCGSKLRARRIAEVILDLYPIDGLRADNLREWTAGRETGDLQIAQVNRIDGLEQALGTLARFHPSEYVPNARPGSHVSGVRNENLVRLTYEDDRFDLLLTSETLEHVPDLSQALSEIRRVLVPGGRHIFTAPVTPNHPKTFPRARLRPDGSLESLAPPIRHPGGDVGYPVFTELGMDFPSLLRDSGFETEVRFGPISDDDFAQVYVCRKPRG